MLIMSLNKLKIDLREKPGAKEFAGGLILDLREKESAKQVPDNFLINLKVLPQSKKTPLLKKRISSQKLESRCQTGKEHTNLHRTFLSKQLLPLWFYP